MPFKLLGTIILLILVTIFCGANLGDSNKCNINFIFHTFENVPVFMTVLISFFVGILVMLPFTFIKKHMTKEEIASVAEKQKEQEVRKAMREEKAKKKAEQREKTLAEQAQKKAQKAELKKKKNEQAKSVNSVPKIQTPPSESPKVELTEKSE